MRTDVMLTRLIKSVWNLAVTITLWAYYIMGFVLIFSPFYLYAFFFSSQREEAFQRLNWRLLQSFFSFMRTIIPRTKWRISDEVSSIRSSIIIANHLSFLDPILFVSIFEKQKTIVKQDYSGVPVFGWILRTSGYMFSKADNLFTEDTLIKIKNMKSYLSNGGNLFIFPEGTRSRDGRIGPFGKGAFRIAKLCRAPIRVVSIRNTDKLYPPDSLLFDACTRNVVEVELVGSMGPDYESDTFSLSGLMMETHALIENRKTN
ncbi:MAG: lysophospholipid acyltransferase family protein [Syntrophales bacterium]